MKTLDLIGLGECMVELFAEEPLATTTVLHKRYGGDVLNALVSAARLGSATGFITRVGDDPFGPGLRAAWAVEGVDISRAPLVSGENGVYFVGLHRGERSFSYRRAGSAASQLGPSDVDAGYIASSRAILLSGITQALSTTARAATLEAAQIARQKGTLVAYDPNYRPRLWTAHGGASAARAAFEELTPHTDWLLASYPSDLEFLWSPVLQPLEALSRLAAHVPQGALKLGKQGALLWQQGSVAEIPAFPTRVVDTTGAGDAWDGAFLHGLTHGLAPEQAAQGAACIASLKLAYRGAIPLEAGLYCWAWEVMGLEG